MDAVKVSILNAVQDACFEADEFLTDHINGRIKNTDAELLGLIEQQATELFKSLHKARNHGA